jgi:hypothetical protein
MKSLDIPRMLKAYAVFKSTRHVAKIFHVSHMTVKRKLLANGIALRAPGVPPAAAWRGGNRGAVMRWCEAHPGVALPLENRALAALVGCTRAEASRYLAARRKRFLAKVKALPDLTALLGGPYTTMVNKKRMVLFLVTRNEKLSLFESELDAILARLKVT